MCVCVFLFVARGALPGLVESSGVYSRLKVYRMFYLSSSEMCLTSREPKEDSRLTKMEIHFYMKGKLSGKFQGNQMLTSSRLCLTSVLCFVVEIKSILHVFTHPSSAGIGVLFIHGIQRMNPYHEVGITA